MIFGYARHGKDTVAEILHQALGLRFVSSSFAAAEKVMVPFLAAKGITYASLEECYADRVNRRQDWYEQIKAYNTPDSAKLAREIYTDNDIYVGIRNVVEFEAIRDEGLFDYSIWVDRSKHVEPESTVSTSVLPSMANYVLDNNGTLEQLRVRALALYSYLSLRKGANEGR
jgi:dephospho-CoA kinase